MICVVVLELLDGSLEARRRREDGRRVEGGREAAVVVKSATTESGEV